jgi:hypothetical protein
MDFALVNYSALLLPIVSSVSHLRLFSAPISPLLSPPLTWTQLSRAQTRVPTRMGGAIEGNVFETSMRVKELLLWPGLKNFEGDLPGNKLFHSRNFQN